ncbi:MAG: hypothetical protein HY064_01655 [Bacteroidetes bacterium]|nr:hypothetical protein [Bacteroidota bacterium]
MELYLIYYDNELITKNFLLKIFITAILFFPLFVWSQEAPNKGVKAGWAMNIGAGVMFGGNLGIQIENQILLKEKLRLSPFVSAGVGEGGTDPITSKKYYWFGYAAGANLEYGKKHRIILGSHFVGNNLIENSNAVKKNFFGGLSFILGYKGTADFGLIWQVYIGDLYSPDDDPFSANKKYEHRSQVGIGLGYKF